MMGQWRTQPVTVGLDDRAVLLHVPPCGAKAMIRRKKMRRLVGDDVEIRGAAVFWACDAVRLFAKSVTVP